MRIIRIWELKQSIELSHLEYLCKAHEIYTIGGGGHGAAQNEFIIYSCDCATELAGLF
jgi:hypothetical protein